MMTSPNTDFDSARRPFFRSAINAVSAKWERIKYRRIFASRFARSWRLSRLRHIARQRPLRIAFQIAQAPKWKSDELLELMKHHPRIIPSFWICSFNEDKERETEQCRQLCRAAGVPVYEYSSLSQFPQEERPDIVFVQEAYDGWIWQLGVYAHNICYIPYSLHNSVVAGSFNNLGTRIALFNFYENDYVATVAKKLRDNVRHNIVVSGSPLTAAFLAEDSHTGQAWKPTPHSMKKVIWAPHWTLTPELSWFAQGTFLKTAEIMQELAVQYADRIQFAFKPHPCLHRELVKPEFWGAEKTAAFYRWWAEQPNTQLEEGAYVSLFMQSDAMIHDSASFLLEYQYADKPALFLSPDKVPEKPIYNDMTRDGIKCHCIGYTQEEIEQFLQECVLGTQDPKAQERARVRATYLLPPNGKSCAENVMDTLTQALQL